MRKTRNVGPKMKLRQEEDSSVGLPSGKVIDAETKLVRDPIKIHRKAGKLLFEEIYERRLKANKARANTIHLRRSRRTVQK